MARVSRISVLVVLLTAACWASGCKKEAGPKRAPTFPVTGTVRIDGKPTAGVRVMMYPQDNFPGSADPIVGAPHSAITDSDGNFKIMTYDAGDGAPVGDYVVAYYWDFVGKTVPFSNPDEPTLDPSAVRFNKKYGQPGKSKTKVKVEAEKGADLGTLELTTK